MNKFKLTHIGFVVESIDRYIIHSIFTDIIGRFSDKNQAIYLLQNQNSDVQIELIEPKNDHAPTFTFLNKTGGGFHHFCFQLPNLEETNNFIKQKNLLKTSVLKELTPEAQKIYRAKQCIWAFSKNKELIELLITN